MSSTVSVTPITLEIIPSHWLAYYVVCVHVIAGLSVIFLPVSTWVMCAALFVLVLLCVVTYRTHVSLRSRRAVVALNRYADDAWQLRLVSGASYQARLLPDSYVHPELLVLNFRLDIGERRSVVLMSDSADAARLRRLRVGLMFGVHESKT